MTEMYIFVWCGCFTWLSNFTALRDLPPKQQIFNQFHTTGLFPCFFLFLFSGGTERDHWYEMSYLRNKIV